MGHILFTTVIVSDEKIKAMGLGPMAVLPEKQGQGIGSALIKEGLHICRCMGVEAVFVLGEPGYYVRFGFKLASDSGLYYKSSEFSSYFFAIELVAEALDGISGEVCYHEFFDGV